MPLIERPHDYQEQALADTFTEWQNGNLVVCVVAPTGAGKTIIKAFAVKRFCESNPDKYGVVFAHRDVLLSQISLALAMVGIPHKLICSAKTEKAIADYHVSELGESWLSRESKVIVASVKTWINRNTSLLAPRIGMWAMDEYHHTLRDNTWGQCINELPHALGLGVTATPHRADGQGLGRAYAGFSDALVLTPGMGELIARGRLSPYRVYSIPERFNTDGINITSSGDFNQQKLAKRTHQKMNEIIGDAVREYRRLANGKQGIIFADSVEHASMVAQKFREDGIDALALSSKDDTATRNKGVSDFRKGKLTILVNYDLFGEGFDVPAVEVVIMLRKTMSYGLFKQMFGRCLRVLKGKEYGILIDHVGNVPYFLSTTLAGKYLHDDPEWSLSGKASYDPDEYGTNVINRRCPKCMGNYNPPNLNPKNFICPLCNHRETFEEVQKEAQEWKVTDDNLIEMDTSYLNEIIPKIKAVDESIESFSNRINHSPMPAVAKNSAIKRHIERQQNQQPLRDLAGKWCRDMAELRGLDITSAQIEFNRKFGMTVFDAQILSSSEAQKLRAEINRAMFEMITETMIL